MGLVGFLSGYLVGYLVLLVLLCDWCEAGGHGHGHHAHLRIHLPEFLHHDHHTKVITIHHHHHKPKQHHHHHHHHHHPKPKMKMPASHHHHHHHKKMHHVSKDYILTTSPVVRAHHGIHRHLKPLHDPENDNHQPIHNTPIYNYKPSLTSFDTSNNLGPFVPAVPVVTSSVSQSFNGVPRVHGVQHTVQQVTSFDTMPGVPTAGAPGYKVTEEGEEEDTFTAVNSVHEFPGTGFGQDDFTADYSQNLERPSAEFAQPTAESHDSILTAPQLTSVSADGIESYRNANDDLFPYIPTSRAVQSASTPPNQNHPESLEGTADSNENDPTDNYSGEMVGVGSNYLTDVTGNYEYPVSFHLE